MSKRAGEKENGGIQIPAEKKGKSVSSSASPSLEEQNKGKMVEDPSYLSFYRQSKMANEKTASASTR